ncbi:MAG: serine--tRNA ligase, partial [Verrucomicrobia bacterium]|nr:serine--tRNA ligase [Verrucomicrobiota bacterium]
MLDVKVIREKTDWVRARLAARNAGDEAKIQQILDLDDARRKNLAESEALKAQRNKVSKEIGALMGQKKIDEANAKKKETADIGRKISDLDKELVEIEEKRQDILLRTPNTPHDSVPTGKDSNDNPVIKVYGEKPVYNFKPLNHIELCEKLGLIDFARATKISGRGFVLYTNWG